MSFRLKVLAGRDQGQVFLLPASGSLTIGRGEADITLNDLKVSRSHFRITVAGNQVRVCDLGSTAGTRVNNEPALAEVELQPGGIVAVGETWMQLLADPTAARAAPTRPTLAPGKVVGAATTLRRPDKPPSAETMPRPASASSASTGRSATEVGAVAELANTRFGVFALGSVLGIGKKGVVFRAEDTRTHTRVALKVFVPRFSRDEESVQRLAQAIKTLHPLQHLNLIHIHGAGRTEGSCWLSAELIDGISVAGLVEQAQAAPPDWRAGLRVAVDVADALMYLHGEQVLHRNITPENLVVRRADWIVKIADVLTIKKRSAARTAEPPSEPNLVSDVRWLAPERTWGDPSAGDDRSDLYSLGAVVYAALTGKPPIEGDNPVDTRSRIQTLTPRAVRKLNPNVPPALEAIVMRLLNKQPEDRFADATELLGHLLAVEESLESTVEEEVTWRRRKRSGSGETRGAGMNGPTWIG
jgi:serine/threonine protein kinase